MKTLCFSDANRNGKPLFRRRIRLFPAHWLVVRTSDGQRRSILSFTFVDPALLARQSRCGHERDRVAARTSR